MARVFIATVGCRLNQCESDSIAERACTAGHTLVSSPAEADIQVINTCTITRAADADTRQTVRRAKRANPAAELVVTGCYASGEHRTKLPEVNRWVSNNEKRSLFDRDGDPANDPLAGDFGPALAPRRSRALLKIQDGCDFGCAYCIVPAVRGASRSLPIATAVTYLEQLVAAGQGEICLTGVHIGTYGRDLRPRRSLVELLSALVPRLGPARLRLGSLDPHEVTGELCAFMAAHRDRICRHLHLPMQSGDAAVLRRMRRAHTVEDLFRTAGTLADAIEGIAIGSDVIVGFPGETQAEAQNTYDLVDALPLAYCHVFSFSRRPGTLAYDMPNQVSESTRSRRSARLRELTAIKRLAFATAQLDKPLPAIAIAQRHKETHNRLALTDNYLQIELQDSGSSTPPEPKTWVTARLAGVASCGPHPARCICSPG